MRVAVITEQFPRVSETFILDHVAALVRAGLDVTVITKRKHEGTPHHPSVTELRILDRTIELPVPAKHRRVAVGARVALSLLSRESGHTRWATCRGLAASGEGLAALGRLALLSDRKNDPYDVVHAHYLHNGLLGAFMKQAGMAHRLFVTAHGYDLRVSSRKARRSYTPVHAQADRILAHSRFAESRMRELGADSGRVTRHPNGVDLTLFQPAQSAPRSSRAFRILTVARLVREKAVHVGLEAVSSLVDSAPGTAVEYVVVGQGPLLQHLLDLRDRLRLDEVARFVGALERPELLEELRSADVFLLTSQAEGLPIVLLEAQAMGLPVIATDVGAVREAVLPGRSAVLTTGDPRVVAQALRDMAQSPAMRARFGRAGRAYVSRNFNAACLNQRLISMYREAVAGR